MSIYYLVYLIHVSAVILSVGGFVVRGGLMLADSPLLNAKPVRVVPHIVDTVLLASALWLAWMIHQYPFVHHWLTVKVVALVVYILLGMVALRRGPTKPVRATAFVLALATAGFIVSVALAHHPLGIFSGL